MINDTSNIASLSRQAKSEVVDAIRLASSRTGVDFSYLLQKAATESGFDTKAQASTSSARGLYQFIDRTWLDTIDKHGAEHGLGSAADAIARDSQGNPVVNDAEMLQKILALRDNPGVSACMAAELTKDNQASLESSLGRKVGNTELYLAHFLGANGAAKFLTSMENNPECKAAQVMPEAAHANQGVFYRGGQSLTVDEVFTRFADQFGDEGVLAESSPELEPQSVEAATIAASVAATTTDLATAFSHVSGESASWAAMQMLSLLRLNGDTTPTETQDWLA